MGMSKTKLEWNKWLKYVKVVSQLCDLLYFAKIFIHIPIFFFHMALAISGKKKCAYASQYGYVNGYS